MNQREIKFRGMAIQGKWHFGNLVILSQKVGILEAGSYISNSVGVPFAYRVRPESVGQFAGLKDKNGKEIYEGDRVSLQGDFGIVQSSNTKINNMEQKSLCVCGHEKERHYLPQSVCATCGPRYCSHFRPAEPKDGKPLHCGMCCDDENPRLCAKGDCPCHHPKYDSIEKIVVEFGHQLPCLLSSLRADKNGNNVYQNREDSMDRIIDYFRTALTQHGKAEREKGLEEGLEEGFNRENLDIINHGLSEVERQVATQRSYTNIESVEREAREDERGKIVMNSAGLIEQTMMPAKAIELANKKVAKQALESLRETLLYFHEPAVDGKGAMKLLQDILLLLHTKIKELE